MTWPELDAQLRDGGSFLVTTHTSPDGDCIGSQLALLWYLESLGKRVTIYDHDEVPDKVAFLRGSERITTVRPQGSFDVLVVLDCSNPQRLGWEGATGMARRIVNIDHHRDNTLFGTLNIVEARSATAEILYELFEEGGLQYPAHVAEALYAAILTDTGGFRFSNTTARVLRICGELAGRGADPAAIYDRIYAWSSQAGMRLYAAVWPTLAFRLGGRVCTMELPLQLIDEFGATYGDSEGMADLTITAADVQVGVFIKHTPRQTHFSLRSRSADIDVGGIARRVKGGGGHVNAAGCTIDEPISAALPRMLAIIEQELR